MTTARGTFGPRHHPDEGLLMDYAAGAAHEGASLLIATHLALCPPCRDTVRRLESLGGVLIADLPPSALAPGSRAAMMARLDAPYGFDAARSDTAQSGAGRPAPRSAAPQDRLGVPSPLRDYVGGDLHDLAWRRLAPGIDQVEVPIGGAAGHAREQIRLLRLRGGVAIPRHTHRGTEMVLVLAGGFRDGGRQFLRGDVSLSDQQVDHSPQVDAGEPCICLSVTDAPLRFTGLVGYILNLFVRF